MVFCVLALTMLLSAPGSALEVVAQIKSFSKVHHAGAEFGPMPPLGTLVRKSKFQTASLEGMPGAVKYERPEKIKIGFELGEVPGKGLGWNVSLFLYLVKLLDRGVLNKESHRMAAFK